MCIRDRHNVLTGDYDIIILDNDFSYPSSYQEGYVNLNRKVFSSPGFKKLRAKEKALLLLLLQRTHENRSSYQIGTKKFYEKYMALLGVTKHVLRGYLHSLKKFFSIGVKDGKYFITFLWRVSVSYTHLDVYKRQMWPQLARVGVYFQLVQVTGMSLAKIWGKVLQR